MTENNIVAFPDKLLTSWKVYERLITEWLSTATTNDPARIAAICDGIRPIYLAAAQIKQAGPAPSDDPMHAVNQWVASTIAPLLQEIALRQMKLENAALVMHQLFTTPGGPALFASAGLPAPVFE